MKFKLQRDETPTGGIRLSMVITAANREEAVGDFEARWQQKVKAHRDEQIKAGAWMPNFLRPR